MTIAAFATGASQGLPLHPRRVPRGRGARRAARSSAPARPASSGRTSSARASPSTSSSGAAPAPTSAARRRRSSSRSRASAASRATSRRSRSRSGCSASRPSSTTSRRWPTSRSSSRMGGEAFARIGTEGSTGPEAVLPVGPRRAAGRLRGRVRGDAARPDRAGRRRAGRPRRSGRSCSAARPGVFVGPDALDMPLTFEATRAAGATLGSGVIMVFDETADLVDTLRRIAQFFRDESCGQCVPCRVGSVRQEELLARLAAGSRVRPRDEELGAAARDRPGDARRVDLRARPDGVVGDRVGAPPAGDGGAVSDGLSMDRDPAPDRANAARRRGTRRPAADRHPAHAAGPGVSRPPTRRPSSRRRRRSS